MIEKVVAIILQLDDHVGAHRMDITRRAQAEGLLDAKLNVYQASKQLDPILDELVSQGRLVLAPRCINTYHLIGYL